MRPSPRQGTSTTHGTRLRQTPERSNVPVTGRIAACWCSEGPFDVKVTQTDLQSHRIALYFLDYDSYTRAERVDVKDTASGAFLDRRNITGFHSGTYLAWDTVGN